MAARAGDVLLVRGPEPYTFADGAETADDIRIRPGPVCVDRAGRLVDQSMVLGVRTWGNVEPGRGGETVMLIGTCERETAVGAGVLSRLPAAVVLRGVESPLVPLLVAETVTEATVAGKVGYGSAFAPSSAFKRVRGISPAEYRRTVA